MGQVFLPDDLGKARRAQPVSQRRVIGGRGVREGRVTCVLSEQVSHSSGVIRLSAEKGTADARCSLRR
jgi:hypothetical protein